MGTALMSILLALKASVGTFVAITKDVLAVIYGAKAAAGSLKGYVNVVELLRIVVPALLHGGLTWAVLGQVVAGGATIFSGPYAPVVIGVLTALYQAVRLINHEDPTPPAPVPATQS